MGKFSYLVEQCIGSLGSFGRSIPCPNCGGRFSVTIDSKYVVSRLRQCGSCGINFRFPVDRNNSSDTFYQNSYSQPGLTTDLPDSKQLMRLLATDFRGSEKDFRHYVNLIARLTEGQQRDAVSILDYGANWGYLVHQLMRVGFQQACGLELSNPRRRYGEQQLNVAYLEGDQVKADSLDLFISLHVIEHMPRPSELLQQASCWLRPGGWLILECPNGSSSARSSPDWSSQWGKIHPFYITDVYLLRALQSMGFIGTVLDAVVPQGDLDTEQWIQSCMQASLLPLNSRTPTESSLLFVGQKLV